MQEFLISALVIIGGGLWLASIFASIFLSNQWLWLAIACGLLGGLCAGIYMNGLPIGLISGLIIGLVMNMLVIPSGLLVKYYRKKGVNKLRMKKE
jgi:hypothetical protein